MNNLQYDTKKFKSANKFPSASRVPNMHLFKAEEQSMLLAVEEGLIYQINDSLAEMLDRTMHFGDAQRISHLLKIFGIGDCSLPIEASPTSVQVRALSLAIAQKCNLGCTYCYAQQGTFGGNAKNMAIDVAKASIDQLLKETKAGESIELTFLGGEPLVNRAVLQAATEYAKTKAEKANVKVSFSLTTNGTLLTEDDTQFFDQYGFAVTISIDGSQEAHNTLRPFKSGRGSYEYVIEGAKRLLKNSPRRYQVTARVTVTPKNLCLSETLQELLELGFDAVMFSPMLNSPNGQFEMGGADFETMLTKMIECGRIFEQNLLNNKIYPFTNIISTLQKIHQYRRNAYPCGAGGGYMGVSSEGGLFACHRFVNDEQGSMGDIVDGVDTEKQKQWLDDRNVHLQEPCRTCWARYLCSGGCHHEAIYRGRPACDYIRGWLHYCLSVYVNLLQANPPLLAKILNTTQQQS